VQGQSAQVGEDFQGAVPSAPTYDLLRESDQKIEKLQQQIGSLLPVICYLYMLFYGLSGSKPNSARYTA
jgi:hypothetical protein